jgi:acetate kinase
MSAPGRPKRESLSPQGEGSPMSAPGRPKRESLSPQGEGSPASAPGRPPRQPLLVLNCGSSSIKFALFDGAVTPLPREPLWAGQVEGIGSAKARLLESDALPVAVALDAGRPHYAALLLVRDRVDRRTGGHPPAAVAHRVVHGGSRFTAPVRIDAAVLAELKGCIALAPLHQPYALQAIETLLAQMPELPQVACFDTAFHRTLPPVEQLLPLPYAQFQRGVRRYGFHGLSYEYMAIALAERHGDWARGRTIVAHLGSGASLCAMQGLRSVATTMGYSALDGLMMGTRTGALDPGVILHLLDDGKLGVAQLTQLLYRESGLLGVSGLSASPKDLLAVEGTRPRARAALDLYVRRIVREIGALTAALGGLDMLAFTAGVGENSAVLRERICAAFEWLGLFIDHDANRANAATISTPRSRIRVAVEPTREEWMAASHALQVLGADAGWCVAHPGEHVGQAAVPIARSQRRVESAAATEDPA